MLFKRRETGKGWEDKGRGGKGRGGKGEERVKGREGMIRVSLIR